MEKLEIKTGGIWAEVEILQWMERNTRVFATNLDGTEYTAPLNSKYQSERRIAELIGAKELYG